MPRNGLNTDQFKPMNVFETFFLKITARFTCTNDLSVTCLRLPTMRMHDFIHLTTIPVEENGGWTAFVINQLAHRHSSVVSILEEFHGTAKVACQTNSLLKSDTNAYQEFKTCIFVIWLKHFTFSEANLLIIAKSAWNQTVWVEIVFH